MIDGLLAREPAIDIRIFRLPLQYGSL